MKYRVELDIFFDVENDAIAFCNLIEEIKDKVNTSVFPNDEPTLSNTYKCRYHPCSHDEDPAKPCSGYVSVDFKKPELDEHVNEKAEVIKYKTVDVTTETSLSIG